MVITCKCGEELTFFSNDGADIEIKLEATNGNIEIINDVKAEFINGNDEVITSINTSTQQCLIGNTSISKISIFTLNKNGNANYLARGLVNVICNRDCVGQDRTDQLPTATSIVSAIKNCQVDTTFSFILRNTGTDNVLTLGTNSGITLQGKSTIAHKSGAQWLFTITNVDTPTIIGYLVSDPIVNINVGWTNTHSIKLDGPTGDELQMTNQPPAAIGFNRSSNGDGNEWSVSLWHKATNTGQLCAIIQYFPLAFLSISCQPNGKLDMTWGELTTYFKIQTTNTINNGAWRHLMITFNGGETGGNQSAATYGANFKIYIDGANQTFTPTLINNGFQLAFSASTISIGQGGLDVYTDEFAIFDSDVQSLASNIYNSGTPMDLDTLVLASPQVWLQFTQTDINNFPTIKNYGSLGSDFTALNMTTANIVIDLP